MTEVYLDIRNPYYPEFVEGEDPFDTISREANEYYMSNHLEDKYATAGEAFREYLIGQGYDGAVLMGTTVDGDLGGVLNKNFVIPFGPCPEHAGDHLLGGVAVAPVALSKVNCFRVGGDCVNHGVDIWFATCDNRRVF